MRDRLRTSDIVSGVGFGWLLPVVRDLCIRSSQIWNETIRAALVKQWYLNQCLECELDWLRCMDWILRLTGRGIGK